MKKEVILLMSLLTSTFLSGKDAVQLLDVRTQEEWDEKHIEGSTLIDFRRADFKDQLSKLDKAKSYEVFCRSGNRSGSAVKLMNELGFKKANNAGSLEDAVAKFKGKCVGPGCPKL